MSSKRNCGRTGPTSSTGKETSSKNRTSHGCRSTQIIVKGERQEDYDALREHWTTHYATENFAIAELVEEIIHSAWMLQRARRNEALVHQQLGETSPLDWTKEDHERLNLFVRYAKTAENSFRRAVAQVERMIKDELDTTIKLVKLDIDLRDREENRAWEIWHDADHDLEWLRKRHPQSNLMAHETKVREMRQRIRNKYIPFDDYLPEEEEEHGKENQDPKPEKPPDAPGLHGVS